MFLILVALYFLPTILAFLVDKGNTGWTFIINLFLGWTVIGWFFAFFYGVMV